METKTHGDDEELVVWEKGGASRVVAFGDQLDAVADKGIAIAFGSKRSAVVKSPVGYAVTFGGGEATAQTAVTVLTTGGKAVADRTAVALNHCGVAVGEKIAFADNLESQAVSQNIAINAGTRGLADGPLSLSLGSEGVVVAREGGVVAIAQYSQRPGRWESPHGGDPFWVDGEEYISDIKVAKVGERGIRPNYLYRLNSDGDFVEIGPSA